MLISSDEDNSGQTFSYPAIFTLLMLLKQLSLFIFLVLLPLLNLMVELMLGLVARYVDQLIYIIKGGRGGVSCVVCRVSCVVCRVSCPCKWSRMESVPFL